MTGTANNDGAVSSEHDNDQRTSQTNNNANKKGKCLQEWRALTEQAETLSLHLMDLICHILQYLLFLVVWTPICPLKRKKSIKAQVRITTLAYLPCWCSNSNYMNVTLVTIDR